MTGPKVLLVDDERGFLDYTARRLRARGMQVHTATNGDEAVAFVERESVDVVILDLLMPGMDGVETLKAIKAVERGVQVVMLTGHGNERSKVEGEQHGATAYLLKPTDFESLMSTISDAYDTRLSLEKKTGEPESQTENE